MSEKWKDIIGYEGRYQISDLGRVKSIRRYEPTEIRGTKCLRLTKGKILKQQMNRYGYNTVCLRIRGEKRRKILTVHRLVGLYFIENPNKLEQINHIDENKTNNSVDNLEWCTPQYNLSYGKHNINIGISLKGKRISESHRRKILETRIRKPVVKIDKKTMNIIESYSSIRDAGNKTGVFESSISSCCLGKVKTAGGFIWKFK